MSSSIFSTYKQGENRVTSTILSVFENINTAVVTEILQSFIEDSSLELVKFENQVTSADSVPDGRIKGLFDFIIETKITNNSIRVDQISNHLNHLEHEFSKLLVITPDLEIPKLLQDLNHCKSHAIIWGSFERLVNSIELVLDDNYMLLDREVFLLNQLKYFILNEDLVPEDYSNKVLIVPASEAWPFYQSHFIYKCQSNRYFQPSSYMAFYCKGFVKKIIPKILGYIDDVNLHTDSLNELDKKNIKTFGDANYNEIISRLSSYKDGKKRELLDNNYKYIVLSKPNDQMTVRLKEEVENDKISNTNKRTAYVQKQTYVDLNKLKGARFTSELD